MFFQLIELTSLAVNTCDQFYHHYLFNIHVNFNNILPLTVRILGHDFLDTQPWNQFICYILSTNTLIKTCLNPLFTYISDYTFNVLPQIQQPVINNTYFNHFNSYSALNILTLWFQIMSLAILTIWARGVGPRFRPDQLSDLTWKDLLVFLSSFLIISIIFNY